MSERINDAYPAPPVVLPVDLRDYFAAKAMPAVIQSCAADPLQGQPTQEAMFAMRAYGIADAMLKARGGAA